MVEFYHIETSDKDLVYTEYQINLYCKLVLVIEAVLIIVNGRWDPETILREPRQENN